MKKMLTICLGAVLAFALISSASAAPNIPQEELSNGYKKYQPDQESEIIIKSVERKKTDDGKGYYTHVTGEVKNGERYSYTIQFDDNKGTYKTKKTDTFLKEKKSTEEKKKTSEGANSLGSKQPVSAVASLSTEDRHYAASVKLILHDPPKYDLAYSKNYVSWTDKLVGSYWLTYYDYAEISYWANPQTPAFTTWYTDSHDAYYFYYNSVYPYSIENHTSADFHNDDWGWDDQRTYASHSIILTTGQAGEWTYTYDTYESGEDSALLYNEVVITEN